MLSLSLFRFSPFAAEGSCADVDSGLVGALRRSNHVCKRCKGPCDPSDVEPEAEDVGIDDSGIVVAEKCMESLRCKESGGGQIN